MRLVGVAFKAGDVMATLSGSAVVASFVQGTGNGILGGVGVREFLAILAISWAVIRFIFTPLYDELHFRVFERNPANGLRYTDSVIRALTRDDQTKQRVRVVLLTMFEPEIAERKKLAEQVYANVDALEAHDASLKAQGAAMTRELADAMRQIAESNRLHTISMERMEHSHRASQDENRKTNEKIAAELSELTKAYVRLDERIKSWDGIERRHVRREE